MHSLPEGSPRSASLEWLGPDQLPVLTASTREATYRILLQGAQLLEWTPHDQSPVIWLSPHTHLTQGKPPRGGIPICWPWFGPALAPDQPAHGLVRAAQWTLTHYSETAKGEHELVFRLEDARAHPDGIELEVRFCIGAELRVALTTLNRSPTPFSFSEALHSYFGVSDVTAITLSGLGQSDYLDRADADRRKSGTDPLHITGETDRIYLESPSCLRIEDPGFSRHIRITSEGAASVIVWNPWKEKADRLGDLGDEAYLRMVCVESGHAAPHSIHLEPGEHHRLAVTYKVEPC